MALSLGSWDSNSIGTLLSSLSTSSNANSNNLSNLTSLLSDYNQIQSGSYHKLMKSYVAENKVDGKALVSDSSLVSTQSLKDTVSAGTSLYDSLNNLSKSSLYSETSIAGSSESTYNYDEIASKLKQFVNSYNDMMDAGNSTDNSGVQSSVSTMMKYTSVNKNALSAIGITVQSDNTLSLDTNAVKTADVSKIKSLFVSNGSFGSQVKALASSAKSYANSALSTSYSSTGNYNYVTGSTYSSYI